MPRKLERCVENVKKKKTTNSAYGICVAALFKPTTYNNGHRHKWMSSRGYTTIDDGHKHKINKSKMLALSAGKKPHTHRLLKKYKIKKGK